MLSRRNFLKQLPIISLVQSCPEYSATQGAFLDGLIGLPVMTDKNTTQTEETLWFTPYDYGAVGDGVADDTGALAKMFASGHKLFDLKSGKYSIQIPERTSLRSFNSEEGIYIRGNNAVIYDRGSYTADAITSIFTFDTCANCTISGVNYEGQPLVNPLDPKYGIGYLGATFVNLKGKCLNMEIDATLKHCRYGVRSGDYSDPTLGNSRGIKSTLRTYRCGYPVAHYLAEEVNVDVYAEDPHRSVYLAGVNGGTVRARFKNQYIAPIQVMLTDAKTGTGTSRGCSNLKIQAYDQGSTTFTKNSWAAGISLSRVDPGTIFENIDFDILVVSSDDIATTLGAFIVNSVAKLYQPTYSFNWESSIYLRNIKISGVVNRSNQTLATHGIGEVYIRPDDGLEHAATITSLDLERLQIISGSGRNPSALSCILRNSTNSPTVKYCNFSNYKVNFVSNPNAPFNFIGCAPFNGTSA